LAHALRRLSERRSVKSLQSQDIDAHEANIIILGPGGAPGESQR
jgi:hypothetical protein